MSVKSKLVEDVLRPNTTNNHHRLKLKEKTLLDATSYNLEDRKVALEAIRALSLDDLTKSKIWNDKKQRQIILDACNTNVPDDLRIVGLRILKNISFQYDTIGELWNNTKSHQVINDALVLSDNVQIKFIAIGILANVALNDKNKEEMYDQFCWTLCNIISDTSIPPIFRDSIVKDSFKVLRRLTELKENKQRFYDQREMKQCLFKAASLHETNIVREQAFGILCNLARNQAVAQKMWKRIDGAKDLLLEASEDTNDGKFTMKAKFGASKNSIGVRQNALETMSLLAAFETNQIQMFNNDFVIERIISGAGIRQPQTVRRFALQTIRHLSLNDEIAKLMWNRSPKLIHIIMEGGKKTVVNFIRVEAIETIANLANISENRNLMWQNRGCRNVVLSACEVVVLPTNVDTTPPIEAAGLKALGLLTGVKMC
jgi:hypothetical protein